MLMPSVSSFSERLLFLFFSSSLTISLLRNFSNAFFAFKESIFAVIDATLEGSAFCSDCFSAI